MLSSEPGELSGNHDDQSVASFQRLRYLLEKMNQADRLIGKQSVQTSFIDQQSFDEKSIF